MRFSISPELLKKLNDRTASREKDALEITENAFLLFPGMGPALYLTSDGRILRDGREWDESSSIEEGTDDDAVAALVIGADNLDLPDLIRLLPQPSVGASPCTGCGGSRWFAFKDYFGKAARVICSECRGRGYMSPASPK